MLGAAFLLVLGLVIGHLVEVREMPAVTAPAVGAPTGTPAAAALTETRARPIYLGLAGNGDGQDEGWSYDAVSPEEQAAIDRGRDVTGWDGVHSAFSEAAHQGLDH